jgi:L-lactate dehydrogenase complex protein LldE
MASVALFDPCYMGALRPDDARHARHVLETLGDTVALIDGRCCGQPAFNSGFRDQARTVGRELLKAAQPHATIVVPSGSCTTMVRHFLPHLFEGQRQAGAQSIAGRFQEFAAYVAAHPRLESTVLKLEGTVAYHDACHARRELGLTDTVLGLLARVEGLEVRRLAFEEDCCGFGGAFSVKLPEVSVAMMTAKLDDVSATGAKVLVSTDFSCLAHLDAGARGIGLKLETWSIAELLSRALG